MTMATLEVTIIIGTGCRKPFATLVTTLTDPESPTKVAEQLVEKYKALEIGKVEKKDFDYISYNIKEFYEQIRICCKNIGSRLYKIFYPSNGSSIELVFTK